MAEYITSLNNATVKKAASLFKKSARDKEGLFLVEGDSLVFEALSRGFIFEFVFVCENSNLGSSMIEMLEKKVKKVYIANEQVMKKISELNTPPSLIGCANFMEISQNEIKKGKYVLLEDMQDPGNLGAVIRSAAALILTYLSNSSNVLSEVADNLPCNAILSLSNSP